MSYGNCLNTVVEDPVARPWLLGPTMSAKSRGARPVIYAVDEIQNALPRKTMLFDAYTNSTGGRNHVLPYS